MLEVGVIVKASLELNLIPCWRGRVPIEVRMRWFVALLSCDLPAVICFQFFHLCMAMLVS